MHTIYTEVSQTGAYCPTALISNTLLPATCGMWSSRETLRNKEHQETLEELERLMLCLLVHTINSMLHQNSHSDRLHSALQTEPNRVLL